MNRSSLWFVRSGVGGVNFHEFRSKSYVGIGWDKVGKIAADISDEHLRARFDEAYPDESPGTRRSWAAQTRRFLRDVQSTDGVVTYDPEVRLYILGIIQSAAEFDDKINQLVRHVRWSHRTSRDQLSAGARNSLGVISTIFKPSAEAAQELREKASATDDPVGDINKLSDPTDEEDTEQLLRKEQARKSEQFIEDRIVRLTWDQMQELIAGLLRAMGYRTRVSAAGPDRGHDIFASPDGIGLQEPRIFCEVKHRSDTTSAPQIRSFLGARK